MLTHGGQVHAAAAQYGIAYEHWLDLSTGINPNGYPIPVIPSACWMRLPEEADGLLEVARNYYQAEQLMACAGSQAAIQALPYLRSTSRVGVLHPAYTEHALCWQQAGHQLLYLTPETLELHLPDLDVLILINPNNPTGKGFSQTQLLTWHHALSAKKGWLIVDEAFMDAHPADSLATLPPRNGLIILRSLGKFFGLAGVRCGFVISTSSLLTALEKKLGIWSLSHPSRYVAKLALSDTHWQQQTRLQLSQQAKRLEDLLTQYTLQPTGSNALFQWVKTEHASTIYQQLAQRGIFVRLFSDPESLRFGLPATECDWQRLTQALAELKLDG